MEYIRYPTLIGGKAEITIVPRKVFNSFTISIYSNLTHYLGYTFLGASYYLGYTFLGWLGPLRVYFYRVAFVFRPLLPFLNCVLTPTICFLGLGISLAQLRSG